MGVDLVKILAARGESVTVTSRLERQSETNNVKYVQGNAHDRAFIRSLLHAQYDAIVDFMVYNTEEFKLRWEYFLNYSCQYVFLSSSRVYADSSEPLTEESPRLLDVTLDEAYIKTDDYALAKARQENILLESGKSNWTIVRPYITYSNQRLQLGVYEKEQWLYRALHNQTVVFPIAIAEKYTTMTLGRDVAMGISMLIGNKEAMGKVFHITSNKKIKWDAVLQVYEKVIEDVTGNLIRIKYVNDLKPVYEAMGNKYQVIYDRLFNREFDNSKFEGVVGKLKFTEPEKGLKQCLIEFLDNPKFRDIPMRSQAWMDKEMKEHTPLKQIDGATNKIKYSIGRYTPYFVLKAKGK